MVRTTRGWAPFLANPQSNDTDDRSGSDTARYGGDWELLKDLMKGMNFRLKGGR